MELKVEHLTKIFPNGKGIFDVSFSVKEGEVFGYLGPNGAGKSTTIRHLMGFMKPDKGSTHIDGLDCWSDSAEIQKSVGYLPGEIAFLEGMTGLQYLELLAGMRRMRDHKRRDHLIDRLQFDVKTPIRKMSKGMKQKVGITAAFMHDPKLLVLDEPTSGLDPLMQQLFVDMILEEKERGKTILMSSHSFAEIESTCDRAGIIKDGQLVAAEEVHNLQSVQRKIFVITLKKAEDVDKIRNSGLIVKGEDGLNIEVEVQGEYNQLVEVLSDCDINSFDARNQKLEDVFMHFYKKEGENR